MLRNMAPTQDAKSSEELRDMCSDSDDEQPILMQVAGAVGKVDQSTDSDDEPILNDDERQELISGAGGHPVVRSAGMVGTEAVTIRANTSGCTVKSERTGLSSIPTPKQDRVILDQYPSSLHDEPAELSSFSSVVSSLSLPVKRECPTPSSSSPGPSDPAGQMAPDAKRAKIPPSVQSTDRERRTSARTLGAEQSDPPDHWNTADSLDGRLGANGEASGDPAPELHQVRKKSPLIARLQNTRGLEKQGVPSLSLDSNNAALSFSTSPAPALSLLDQSVPLATELDLSPSEEGKWSLLWHSRTDLNDEHMSRLVETGGEPLVIYEEGKEDELLPPVPARLQAQVNHALFNRRVNRHERAQLQEQVQGVSALRSRIVKAGAGLAVGDYGVSATVPAAMAQRQVLERRALPLLQEAEGSMARSLFFRRRLGSLQHARASCIAQYLEAVAHPPPSDALAPLPVHTLRVQQTLSCRVSLPPEAHRGRRLGSRERGWCRVESLQELRARVEEGRAARRLVVVAAAEQANFWETCFMQIAARYPRVVFLSITAANANAGPRELREQLLQCGWVCGVHFVSITPSWERLDSLAPHVRAFCGNDKVTETIMEALVNRYQASVASTLLPELEPRGLQNTVFVNAAAARLHLLSLLRFPPLAYDLAVQHAAFAPEPSSGPFAVQSCASLRRHAPPPGFRVALRDEQLQSLAWMVAREQACAAVVGEVEHRATVDAPPLRPLALRWRLRAEFHLRGGVLADTIGYGKTAVALALVASHALPRAIPALPPDRAHLPAGLLPSRATLVVLPPHLLQQWAAEARKFCGGSLECVLVDSVQRLRYLRAADLQLADLVLASTQIHLLASSDPSSLRPDRRYLAQLEALWEDLASQGAGASASRLQLEMFYWHRLIVDEVHELVPPDELGGDGDPGQVWGLPVERLFARSRWGLTGTPPVQRSADVDRLAAFLQVHLGEGCGARAQGFVDAFVRSSAAGACALAPPVHHTVNVTLSKEEEALYRDARRRLAGATARGDAGAWGELLGSCSHHSLGSAREERRGTAAEQVAHAVALRAREVERLEERIRGPRERLQALERRVGELQQLVRHTEFETVEREREAERLLGEACGRAEEARDRERLLQRELDAAASSLAYLRETVARVRGGAGAVACPVCGEEFEAAGGCLVITPCAHVYCSPCASRLAGRCATCHGPLAADAVRPLLAEGEGAGAAEQEEVVGAYGKFGSKIAHLVHRLKAIRALDPSAKCLVYCQFDALSRKVMDALEAYGLGALALQGSPQEMGRTLKAFVGEAGRWVLMCSLQKKAAGMNLQCASHVLFVHPFYGRSAGYTDAWEAQAIGRVFRQGQAKQVHIHRFVALGTVEQELIARRDPRGCMKYLPSGSPLQL